MKKIIITTALLAFISLSTAIAQVGIGTKTPDASAALDVESTTKGFLLPRMTSAERNAIATPATGLTIYNTTVNSLQWYNGTGWYDPSSGSTFGFIPGNTTCATATISVTPCSAVAGATLNDDAGTTLGTEYDWSDATNTTLGIGFGAPSNTSRALVEIGGQCWAKFNMNIAPASGTSWCYSTDNSNCNTYGRLYQWSAAMNGSTTERAQGVCPIGWHVPSDCEWMYLENSLGMNTTDQQATNIWRNSGSVGSKLKSGGSSGFTALLAGTRTPGNRFQTLGSAGSLWSSSEPNATTAHAQRRLWGSSQAGVDRSSSSKATGYSVRCLKD